MLAVVTAVGLAASLPALPARRAAAAPTDVTSRVSVATGGGQGSEISFEPSVSADGRYVAFGSYAPEFGPPDNPVPGGDGGGRLDSDVFVHDRGTGTTTRMSLAADDTERNNDSRHPAISADGSQVAFASDAALATGDSDGHRDVYARGRAAGTTTLVSTPDTVVDAGSDRPSPSRDGRLVAYPANAAAPVPAILVRPESLGFTGSGGTAPVRVTGVGAVPGTITGISVAPVPDPAEPAVSVQPAGCTPPRVLAPGASCELTVTALRVGTADVVISHDGVGSPYRLRVTVARPPAAPRFTNQPAGLTAVTALAAPRVVATPAVVDLGILGAGSNARSIDLTNATGDESVTVEGVDVTGSPAIEITGCGAGTVIPAGDLCALTASLTGLALGPQAATVAVRYRINDDCTECFVTRETTEPTVVFGQVPVDGILVADRDTDRNGVLDEPGGSATVPLTAPGNPLLIAAGQPSLSADGRYLAFVTGAALVLGDQNESQDVYVLALDANGDGTVGDFGGPELVSVSDGQAGNGFSSQPSISADGHAVAFRSGADNLVPGDGNEEDDVFVHDLDTGSTVRASVTDAEVEANGRNSSPALSADARSVAFTTRAANLGATGEDSDGDEGIDTEVVLRDLIAGSTERISVGTGDLTPPGTDGDEAAISADGRLVAFSAEEPLVAGDSNEFDDVFVRDRRPVARLAPDPLDFGDQPLHRTSGELRVEVGNTGTGPLVVGQLTASGPDAAAVTVTNPCAGVTLFAGETCPTPPTVRVTTARPGPLTATLTLTSSTDPVSIEVRANGAVAGLLAAPSPLDVGARLVGTLGPPAPVTLTNHGTVPVRLTAVRRDGPAAGDLTLTPAAGADRCPEPGGTLAAGASCRLAVRFRPAAVGVRTAALRIDAVGLGVPAAPTGTPVEPPTGTPTGTPTGSAPPPATLPPNQPFTLDLPVTGIGLPGGLRAEPNPARFAPVPLGRAGPPVTVTVRVTEPGPVRVGRPSLSGVDAARFGLDARDCAGRTLPAGGACRLVLRLRPDRVGTPIGAVLLVPSVDIPAPLVVPLLGAGSAPTLRLDPPLGPPGTVVRVTGTGFAPGGAVLLAWDPGLGGTAATATGTGTLDEQVLVLPRDRLGDRVLLATGPGGVRVSRPFLVVPRGAAPPRLVNTG